MRFSQVLSVLAAIIPLASAVVPIEIKGSRFIRPSWNLTGEGEVFQIVGLDYQPGGSSSFSMTTGEDVLSDSNYQNCTRDAYLFQQLGINTIRVYSLNPWISHDLCFSVFNDAGIYVIADVNTPYSSINRDAPASSYNSGYLNNIFGIVDALKGYPNLLGFFAGNEVINDATSAKLSPPYVRAVVRDLKQYISLHSPRTIPVGYSAADEADLRLVTLQYLECAISDNDFSTLDFFGLNSYEWCSGRDNWQTSGYGDLLSEFNQTSVPVFLSEFGCNAVTPRTFTEVNEGIYGPLDQVFSGGLCYEFSQEANNYGLVVINSNGSASIRQDYINLQAAYKKVDWTIEYESSVPDVTRPTCNSAWASMIDKSYQGFNASFNLPATPDENMLKNGGGNTNLGKVVDINSTESTLPVYNVTGELVNNTTIILSPGNQVNSVPGSSSSSSASGSQGSQTATSTTKHKGFATSLSSNNNLLTVLLGLVFAFV